MRRRKSFHRGQANAEPREGTWTARGRKQVYVWQTKWHISKQEVYRAEQTVRMLHRASQTDLSKDLPVFRYTHASPLRTGIDG